MERKITFSSGEYYHIYSRGINKKKIYTNHSDYLRFLVLLYLANNTEKVRISDGLRSGKNIEDLFDVERFDTLVDIGAYVLMPNHFHILVHEKIEGGISLFMEKLLTGYSMYFNKKYDRTGSLFEGRFKATHANKDTYLKYLFSYIHLNPVKLIDSKWKENGITDRTKAKKYLDQYKYSSYLDYITGNRKEGVVLSKNAFPDYFSEQKDFKNQINDWLSFNEDITVT